MGRGPLLALSEGTIAPIAAPMQAARDIHDPPAEQAARSRWGMQRGSRQGAVPQRTQVCLCCATRASSSCEYAGANRW